MTPWLRGSQSIQALLPSLLIRSTVILGKDLLPPIHAAFWTLS